MKRCGLSLLLLLLLVLPLYFASSAQSWRAVSRPNEGGWILIHPAKAGSAKHKHAAPTHCRYYRGNRLIGCRMAIRYGWWGGEFKSLDTLWTYESHWNTRANNPRSSACGIPQAMNDCSYGYSPATQIAWGLRYVHDRYRRPSVALAFWYSHNWY